jgi:hypothetical protein
MPPEPLSEGWITGILLSAEAEGDTLVLRLDRQHWGTPDSAGPFPITTLAFEGCGDVIAPLRDLREVVDSYIECNVIGSVPSLEIEIEANSFLPYVEVRCSGGTVTESEYTFQDLWRNHLRLYKTFDLEQTQRLRMERENRRLKETTRAFLAEEIERCRRKLEFFERTNPDRAAEMRGRLAAYERVGGMFEKALRIAADDSSPQ